MPKARIRELLRQYDNAVIERVHAALALTPDPQWAKWQDECDALCEQIVALVASSEAKP